MKHSLSKFVFSTFFLIFIYACGNFQEKTKEESKHEVMYIGTYTKEEGHVDGQADGIYTIYMNSQGRLSKGKTVAELTNPSFVKASKDGKYLYAVSELGENDAASGYIYAYKINNDESLEELAKLSTEAFAPCHIGFDKSGDYVFVANYTGGVVMLYKKNIDGSLQKKQRIDLENPGKSHPHSVTVSADNRHAYIADLGNDKIWIFDFDNEKGILKPSAQSFVKLEEGAGPRHFTISKKGDFAYSINELNSSVSAFKVSSNGGLRKIQDVSSLPNGFKGENAAADIHLHPSGNFLYVSNRGHNSIASFKISKNSGKLEFLEHVSTKGKTPRNFAIEPKGRFLLVANQDSNSIVPFEINAETGFLKSKTDALKVKTPVCIAFIEGL